MIDCLSMVYHLDPNQLLWRRPQYTILSYSDGVEMKSRVHPIVAEANDLLALYAELTAHCKDLPSAYHLSSARANLLGPFEADLTEASVLEVGAGCDAIARQLGDDVVALEWSLRSANIGIPRLARRVVFMAIAWGATG